MIGVNTHPWMSGLFGDDDMGAVFAPVAELNRFLRVEAAWTRALGDIEDTPEAGAIAKSIQSAPIHPDDLEDGFARDGVAIPALVTALKAHVGAENAHWVHRGLTSQDVMDTALVFALRDVLDLAISRLNALNDALGHLSDQHAKSKVMAYTRMQPALPTTGAELVAKWRQPISDILGCLAQAHDGLSVIQWGGPIGVRDHRDADRLGAAFAGHLDLQDPGFAWHTDRTRISRVAGVLAQIATLTGKIGADIALMAAMGPAQITLSGGTSSAMAHKNNPVKAETLIALSDYAFSMQYNMLRSARHEGHRSGSAWTLEWLTLAPLCTTVGAGLLRAHEVIGDIKTLGE